MSNYFDDLIKEGRDTDAMRLFAREYYEQGKMGHTRLRLLIRIADEKDKLNTDNAALRAKIAELENLLETRAPEGRNITNGQWVDLCTKNRDLGKRIAELEAELAVTGRALEVAAELSADGCPFRACNTTIQCDDCWKEHYLQQARAELAGEADVQRD